MNKKNNQILGLEKRIWALALLCSIGLPVLFVIIYDKLSGGIVKTFVEGGTLGDVNNTLTIYFPLISIVFFVGLLYQVYTYNKIADSSTGSRKYVITVTIFSALVTLAIVFWRGITT